MALNGNIGGSQRVKYSNDSKKTLNLLQELGFDLVIGTKGEPLQAPARRVVKRVISWNNCGFTKLANYADPVSPAIDALINLANSFIVVRRMVKESWIRY